jgi:hypothetical protein
MASILLENQSFGALGHPTSGKKWFMAWWSGRRAKQQSGTRCVVAYRLAHSIMLAAGAVVECGSS